ncbi:cysteine desulfurase NifS [Tepidibacter hydrothermalis]|uniref:Cysteine desulfurase IscS n=1 Tax=Tepidibacter hydrothermalis TaxID=3036126 RepID=A0ABY8E7I3_9FIRM|nr:cysteine desulfurase NifS [Tepidibacter hydrothermalis]WFD08814.1 cysteine desulfurase NifS [Tepidibacter hydrothermalis]
MEKRRVYMDYAATTPMKKEVLDAMLPYYNDLFGNASSVHAFGREVKGCLDEARDQVAKLINAQSSEIYFTGGGSEADNWAIKGVAFANKEKGNHIITTKIEHHAVLHTCEYLEKHHGFEITYLDVDSEGRIDLEELKNSITDKTILISVMFANNEIGTVEPIKEIGQIAKERGVLFHTDGVQAIGNVHIDVKDLGVDLMAMSAHKIYGPKGVGALYIRKGVKLHSIVHGGAQEKRRRAGTENMAGIVGFGKAAEIARVNLNENIKRLTELKERLINGVLEKIPYTRVNGSLDHRLPGNTSFCFEFIEGESLLLSLDMMGIAGSSGSACTSGSLDPSHVLMAIGLKHEIAHGSLRLSLGYKNTEEDVDYVLEALPKIVDRLRQMSPLYEKVAKGGNE